MASPRDLVRARDLAYRHLARRQRSRAELAAYLKGKELPDEVIDETLRSLEGYGYIDDRKFAREFARHLVLYKGLSRSALRFELKRKGVPEEDIAPAIEEAFGEDAEDEEAVALRVARKKAAALAGVDAGKAGRRICDHLRRRGFSFDVIRKTLMRVEFKG